MTLKKQYKHLCYYEIQNDKPPLVMLHAQGVDSTSFAKVSEKLSKYFHLYCVDCYGHGGSLKDKEKYNIVDIGNAITDFIQNVVGEKVYLLGHSSGGLIAAYIASNTDICEKLILEDPPFFSSQGERRKNTFNFLDLSTVCHNYIQNDKQEDFVVYYFKNQYMWSCFPEKSRDKIKEKLSASARKYRQKHPNKPLKVMFWPKAALEGYRGMQNYDPYFGEAFYNDSFHANIPHEDILRGIKCKTLFMKAKTNVGKDGFLMAALYDGDTQKVKECIKDCTVVSFDCGHGIHTEKPKEFVKCIVSNLM